MFKVTNALSKVLRLGEARPVEVYIQPVGDSARPEGRAANPLIIKGLFIS